VSTLGRSLDRINAVGDVAEKDRESKIKTIKQRMDELQKKSGKRPKYDFDSVKGGRKVVEAMIRPTVGALVQATGTYRKALEDQTKESVVA